MKLTLKNPLQAIACRLLAVSIALGAMAASNAAADHVRVFNEKVSGVSAANPVAISPNVLSPEFTAEELGGGVDLTRLKDLTLNRRSAEVGRLTAERQKLLGLAWLTDVGHKRPDTPRGLPLDEARKKAATLEEESRKLAAPMKVGLRLVPVGN